MHGGLANYLPDTEEGVYFALAVLSLLYMGAATIFQVRRTGWPIFERQIFGRIFDSITFSTSFVLLLGLMVPALLNALKDTKPFLFIGALCGLLYSLYALRPRSK